MGQVGCAAMAWGKGALRQWASRAG
jgi:hypothetical protein